MGRQCDKDERLSNGSVVYWSRQFKHKGRWRVPVRCGGCGKIRPIKVRNASKESFTGLCRRCSRLKIDDEILPNGSIILWSKRFEHNGRSRVPVCCGGCGKERVVNVTSASHKVFSGLCLHCSQIVRTKDETLPNGSIIYWSQRFENEGSSCWYVPVRCGGCGEVRPVPAKSVPSKRFSGLCNRCGYAALHGYIIKTGIETLPSGSIIYWDDQGPDKYGHRTVRVRCGGPLCGGYTRYLDVSEVRAKDFTGLCYRCHQYGPKSQKWKGGRIVKDGYTLVKLPPDHPFRCMANKKGYCLEHRLVMAEHLGRPLTKDEIVHHKDGDKQDNRIENLQLLTRTKHHPGYRPIEATPNDKGLIAFLKTLLRRD